MCPIYITGSCSTAEQLLLGSYAQQTCNRHLAVTVMKSIDITGRYATRFGLAPSNSDGQQCGDHQTPSDSMCYSAI